MRKGLGELLVRVVQSIEGGFKLVPKSFILGLQVLQSGAILVFVALFELL